MTSGRASRGIEGERVMTRRSLVEIVRDLPGAALQNGAPLPPELAAALRELRTSAARRHARPPAQRRGRFAAGLFCGTALGAVLGALLAPKPGSELRGALSERARRWSAASEQYRRASDAAGSWVERGREMAGQAREAVSRAVDEARAAAGEHASGSSSGRRPDSDRSIDPDVPWGR
jgi:gas vesicle protein